VAVEVDGRNLILRLAASHFFDAGTATLRPESLAVLDAIGGEMADLKRPVRVEGHTDSGAVRPGRFRDNWELSASRASRVVSYLQDAHQIAPALLSAAGFADTRPIAKEDTAEGREANRRIELVIQVAAGGSIAAMP
jgi:chemotaxis protein MotB